MRVQNRFSFALIAAVVFFAVGPVCGQTAPNAGDLYRQALSAVPTSPEVLAILKADQQSPEELHKALAEGAHAIGLVHQATSVSKCDWGIDTSGDGKLILAFLKPSRNLYALFKLSADSQINSGKFHDAAATLIDTMVLGRRLETVGLFVAKLTGLAFEDGAIKSLAANLPLLDATAVRELTDTLGKLPLPISLDETMAIETRLIGKDIAPASLAIPRSEELKGEILRAMFAAALAAPKGGEANFKSTRDPVGGKPFAYRALKSGYELSSQGESKGKPITLVVGKSD